MTNKQLNITLTSEYPTNIENNDIIINFLGNLKEKTNIYYNPFNLFLDSNADRCIINFVNKIIEKYCYIYKVDNNFFEEEHLLISLFLYLYHYAESELENIVNVARLLRMSYINEYYEEFISDLDRLFEKIEKEDPDSSAVEYYTTWTLLDSIAKKRIVGRCLTIISVLNIHDTEAQNKKWLELDDIFSANNITIIVSEFDKASLLNAELFLYQIKYLDSLLKTKTGRIEDIERILAEITASKCDCKEYFAEFLP